MFIIAMMCLFGCGEQPSSTSEKTETPSTQTGTQPNEKEVPTEKKFKPTDKLASALSNALEGRREATEKFVKDFLKQFKKNRRKNSQWSALIQEIYSPKSPRLHFIQEGKLTEAASALIRRLEDMSWTLK